MAIPYEDAPREKPAQQLPIAYVPVRDEQKLGPTEDLDREPDGVPHQVIGFLAFWIIIMAMLIGGLYLLAGWTGAFIGGIGLLFVATPLEVKRLGNKAEDERDRHHPSR